MTGTASSTRSEHELSAKLYVGKALDDRSQIKLGEYQEPIARLGHATVSSY